MLAATLITIASGCASSSKPDQSNPICPEGFNPSKITDIIGSSQVQMPAIIISGKAVTYDGHPLTPNDVVMKIYENQQFSGEKEMSLSELERYKANSGVEGLLIFHAEEGTTTSGTKISVVGCSEKQAYGHQARVPNPESGF